MPQPIRTRNTSKGAFAYLRLRARGHCKRYTGWYLNQDNTKFETGVLGN